MKGDWLRRNSLRDDLRWQAGRLVLSKPSALVHQLQSLNFPFAFVVIGKCGKLLGSSEGQLTSPGYPGEYPPSTTCKWLISLSQDYQEIRFTFNSVFLEEDRNCVYDYIAVYDVLENQVGERYCGSITRPINKHVRGNVAVVIFRSDSTNNKKGFSLSYKASKSRTPPEINT